MNTLTATDPKATVLPLLEGSTWPGAAEALAQAQALPIPTSKTEAWKYTRVAKLFNQPYAAPKGDASVALPARLPFDATRVVFVNGQFRADLSDDLKTQKGIVIDSLQHHLAHGPVKEHYGTLAPTGERLFTAMNTAAPTDGLILLVTKGVKVEKPIHVLHVVRADDHRPSLMQPRDLFMLHEGAEAELIIEHIALDTPEALVNSVRECVVGEGARLTIHKLQHESNGPANISFEGVRVAAKGNFSISATTLDGALIRNEVKVSLAGPEAHAELNGVYLLNGTTHCDNHTYIGHDVPDCTSDELYKGIVAGKGTSVFNGKVYVKQDAQRTRAYQSNANILLGDDAKVYTKPELEIYADDVKCSHGCTIGRLDEKGLFYLRSRGVSEAEARKLMAHAFITEVVERVQNEEWKAVLTALIDTKLATL
ncbi:MAG TPA: Fe-S cluster assembly protein SufD [Flavobacteriales bacterium]|nr:Fe-S cluster assembly protein SufD [Flavobacteriales bacterium]HMR28355.1 Fe-S cluster assembly protein SufD [Flavobacteriales bacterium]